RPAYAPRLEDLPADEPAVRGAGERVADADEVWGMKLRFMAFGFLALALLPSTASAREEQTPTLIQCKLGTNSDNGRNLNVLLRMFTEESGSGSYTVDSWDPTKLLEDQRLRMFNFGRSDAGNAGLTFLSGN